MNPTIVSTETFAGVDGYSWERLSYECIRGANPKPEFRVEIDRRQCAEIMGTLDVDSLKAKVKALKAQRD